MCKIAICDVCPAGISDMEGMLRRSLFAYQDREIHKFSHGSRLLDQLPERFDLILLGIDEKGIDAKKTAQCLRKQEKHALLLYYGTREQMAPELFRFCPSGFLVKSGGERKNREVLNEAFRQVEERKEKQLVAVLGKGEAVMLRLEEIVSVYGSRSTSTLRLTDEAIRLLRFPTGERFDRLEITLPRRLAELEEMLCRRGFGCPARNCLVNFRHIRRVDACRILLSDGEEVGLTRSRRKQFDQQFVDYLERSSSEDCRYLLIHGTPGPQRG